MTTRAEQLEHPANFEDKDGRLFLVRCMNHPECGLENYLPAVADGRCAWCGWGREQ
jgi:hypothetical protein